MGSYRFTRFWAIASVDFGFVLILIGAPLTFLVLRVAVIDRLPGLGVGITIACGILSALAGFVLGVPFILGGQLALVSLDQRNLLVEIRDEIRARREPDPPESTASGFITRRMAR